MVLPEKKIENEIKGFLNDCNAFWLKTLGGSVPVGTPDILACLDGRFIGIEVKRLKGGRLTKIQRYKLQQIANNGGVAVVATSVADVKEALDKEGVRY